MRAKADKFAAALIFAIVLLHWFTIRPGFTWHSSDYSLYLSHARNIVEGRPYGSTGYILNPAFRSHSPLSYPPVFPLMLAPVYAVFGLNFEAMRGVCVVFFGLLLAGVYLVLRTRAPAACAFAAVAAFGLNPLCWSMKDLVIPDFLFAALLFAAGLFMDRLYERPLEERSKPVPVLTAAGLMWLGFATRSAGIALVPALVLYELLKCRKLTKFAWAVTVVFVVLAGIETILVPGTSTYVSALALSPRAVLETSRGYLYAVYDWWNSGSARWAAAILALGATGLAAYGFARRIRKGFSFCEVFCIPYLTLLLIWNAGYGSRYLLPVLPIYVFYVMFGAFSLPRGRAPAIAALCSAIALTYAARYRSADWSSVSAGTTGFEALSRYVSVNTGPSDVFVCESPRVLSLFTRRSASPYKPSHDIAGFWSWVDAVNAGYVIRNTASAGDEAYLQPSLAGRRERLQLVFASGDFQLYAVRGRQATALPQP